MPRYKFSYENKLKSRYSSICNLLGFEHHALEADPIKIDKLDVVSEKYIDKKVINKSNYYKNLLVKKNDFKKFII